MEDEKVIINKTLDKILCTCEYQPKPEIQKKLYPCGKLVHYTELNLCDNAKYFNCEYINKQ